MQEWNSVAVAGRNSSRMA